jgi:hypothetical protein
MLDSGLKKKPKEKIKKCSPRTKHSIGSAHLKSGSWAGHFQNEALSREFIFVLLKTFPDYA